jgi:hypothetical protein
LSCPAAPEPAAEGAEGNAAGFAGVKDEANSTVPAWLEDHPEGAEELPAAADCAWPDPAATSAAHPKKQRKRTEHIQRRINIWNLN